MKPRRFQLSLTAFTALLILLIAVAAGGSLWLVAQTKQGAKTLARDLGEFMAEVETVEISGGYRVIRGKQ